jgi:hypothetical protein
VKSRQPSFFDARAGLSHPAWWLSLALLALNDHVLKAAGVLPAWLTGKLSDVAGLVVAPVLLAALVGGRDRAPRFAAFAAVTVCFVAIKTSVAASGAYVGALALVGLAARNVCDATDLVALAALPLAWRLCERTPSRWTGASTQRLAVVLGGLACVATSQESPRPPGASVWPTTAWIVNTTAEPVELRLRWAGAAVDCAAAVDWSRVYSRASFQSTPLVVRLGAGQSFPLDRGAALAAIAPGGTVGFAARGGCDAVLVQADGLPTRVLRWGNLPVAPVATSWPQISSTAGGYVVSGSAGALRVEPTPYETRLLIVPLTDEEAPACPEATHYFVSFDARAWLNPRVVSAVAQLPDGCTRLDADGAAAVLCVPAAAVPFRVGDVVSVSRDASSWTLRASRGVTVVVVSSATWRPSPHVWATGVACEGRSACGAWVQHRNVAINDVDPALRAGEVGVVDGWRMYVGGASNTVVRPEACGAHARSPVASSVWFDLVFVQGE